MSPRRSFATTVLGRSVVLREAVTQVLKAAGFRITPPQPFRNGFSLNSPPQHQPVLFIVIAGDKLDAPVRQIEFLKKQHESARIAVLGDDFQEIDIISFFRAGANAYFAEAGTCDAFFKALELVMLGETIVPSSLLSSFVDVDRAVEAQRISTREPEHAREVLMRADDDLVPQLSTRESGILSCLRAGESNKLIARKMGIAEATVKVHVKAILRKIRVQNRTQAAIWAMIRSPASLPADNASNDPCPAFLLKEMKQVV